MHKILSFFDPLLERYANEAGAADDLAKARRPPPAGRVRVPSAFAIDEHAGPCPKNPAHTQTRVYHVDRKTAHAVCDVCGHAWRWQAEEKPLSLSDFALHLAKSLESAEPIATDHHDEPVIMLTKTEVEEITRRLKYLAVHRDPANAAD